MPIDRAMNRKSYCIALMRHFDETHRIPDRWLEANAKSFHFTDDEIAASAVLCPTSVDWLMEPRICGIYFLLERNRITYVGLSNDIPRRIAQHVAGEVPVECVAWFEAPEFYLKEIEAYYIQRIRPPRNTHFPKKNPFTTFVATFDGQIS